ncbi:DUF2442 domain-containing protein [Methylomonas montana]|uniref:DUF2442 domain-containing protein n=1 Tax=Methylomonas montana TaxID=3058963 RepID=UPI002658C31E|nr:DUF2442 domain-containing protein [Methylomonas montana]WKJ88700.1 DUF2442 domain-containing protein [Methylomonas montana]
MKLQQFEQLDGYRFKLVFENGEVKQTDLKELISKHVSIDELASARLDADWGCLEFKNGMVDIEPKTLYKFSCAEHFEKAA